MIFRLYWDTAQLLCHKAEEKVARSASSRRDSVTTSEWCCRSRDMTIQTFYEIGDKERSEERIGPPKILIPLVKEIAKLVM